MCDIVSCMCCFAVIRSSGSNACMRIHLQVAIMELSAVKVAKASSRGPSENSWVTNVAVTKIARSPNITEIDASIVDCKNVWPWACVATVSIKGDIWGFITLLCSNYYGSVIKKPKVSYLLTCVVSRPVISLIPPGHFGWY